MTFFFSFPSHTPKKLKDELEDNMSSDRPWVVVILTTLKVQILKRFLLRSGVF